MFLSSDEAYSLPWMEHFLIIGTTDVTHHDAPDDVKCSADEPDYLLRCFNEFFNPGISEEGVLWSYAGVRPLVGDGNENPELAREIVPNLPEAEMIYATQTEDARTTEYFLYRRTKMFMFLRQEEIGDVEKWFKNYRGEKGFPNDDGYNRKAC